MEPLKRYIEAIEAKNSGDRKKALDLLAESVGIKEPTEIMRNSLDKMLDSNDAVLTVILDRIEKGE